MQEDYLASAHSSHFTYPLARSPNCSLNRSRASLTHSRVAIRARYKPVQLNPTMTDLKGLTIFFLLLVDLYFFQYMKAHSWDKISSIIGGIMLVAGPVEWGSTVYERNASIRHRCLLW